MSYPEKVTFDLIKTATGANGSLSWVLIMDIIPRVRSYVEGSVIAEWDHEPSEKFVRLAMGAATRAMQVYEEHRPKGRYDGMYEYKGQQRNWRTRDD